MSAQVLAVKPGRWLADFWDMSAAPGGCERCLYVHFCFPCASGDVAARTGGVYAIDCICGGFIGMYNCTYFLPWACTRTRLRIQHDIPGSCCEDMAAIMLCPCCYLAQALNHLDIAEAQATAALAGAGSGPQRTVVIAPGQQVMVPVPIPQAYPVQQAPVPGYYPPPQAYPVQAYPAQPQPYTQQVGNVQVQTWR